MTNKKSSESRRKLLKSIAAGGGAVIAGKSLPENRTKPGVGSVMLPAHAETSLVCCEGVFCGLGFDDEIGGSAQVSSDCTIIMEGDSIDEEWSGSGTVAADGSFAFTVVFADGPDRLVTGTVTEGCLSISGSMDDFGSFSAPVDEGFTSIDDCLAGSDIRLKSNIEALSISRKGYNLYKFQYIDENNENTYVGVMAQDIISRNPEAVIQNESGFYMVRYAQIGLKMVTLKQWKSEGPDSVELMH
jgi:hypothetical protein